MMRPRAENDRREVTRRTPCVGSALVLSERVLVAVGVVCLAIFAASCAERSFFQSWNARSFDRQLERVLMAEQHDQTEWTRERISRFDAQRRGGIEGGVEARAQASTEGRGEALGRLEIPRAGVSVMVLEGTDDHTLDRAVGRIEGTARPGDAGNMGIAGHRDSFFRGLRNLETGDAMMLATRDGLARYEVAEISIVEPRDVEVLDPTDEAAITLVTCYPFYFVGNAPKRYIVRANQVAFDAWSRERLDRYANRHTEIALHD